MKRSLSLLYVFFILFSCLNAQNFPLVTVKAGTKIKDYFPVKERYLYPQFIDGKIFMTGGGSSGSSRLNYNVLLGEIEFIKGMDTLIINRKADLKRVVIEQDTFLYKDAYYKLVKSGRLNVCVRDRVVLVEILKQGAMGTFNRTAAGEAYSSTSMTGKYIDLELTDNMALQRKLIFYILTSNNELVLFRKKNVIELYMNKKAEIEKYLKKNKVNFNSQQDILRFSDWLAQFTNKI
jgi:hypothetical protein